MASNPDIQLYYGIRGAEDVYTIDIAPSLRVRDLQLKLAKTRKFDNVESGQLKLFRVDPSTMFNDLCHALLNLTVGGQSHLSPASLLSSVFKDRPTPDVNFVDFVVDPPCLELLCWIEGDDVNNTFVVAIEGNRRVVSIKRNILLMKPESFKNKGPDDIRLYKIGLPNDEHLAENLEGLDGRELLDKMASVSTSFRDVPLGNHLQVMVKKVAAEDQSIRAINAMQASQRDLFNCLMVTVEKFGSWSERDVQTNLRGGAQYQQGDSAGHTDIPEELDDIQSRLSRLRTYIENIPESNELRNAKEYPAFHDTFEQTNEGEGATVENEREFLTFSNILGCYEADAPRIHVDRSSSLKASTFTVHFIVPPFFACPSRQCPFQYLEQIPWKFPVVLHSPAESPTWRKFTPKNDFMVSAGSHWIPLVICEVVSDPKEKDRYRMLVEAIAAARAGQFLMRRGSHFFIVAIYLTKALIAERYIVKQADIDDAVSTYQKNFDLKNEDDAVAFFLEMHNLSTELKELANNLDPRKKERLTTVPTATKDVPSLNSRPEQATPKPTVHSELTSIPEHPIGTGEGDGDGSFVSESIQQLVSHMGYAIQSVVPNHPHLARVSNRATGSVEYLKYVAKGGSNEVEILQYLSPISSPANHTIKAQFLDLAHGTVISMPVAGEWLISLEDPDEQLWSVARQLFEAVGFMHEHRVAHMDIKPHNVLIPPEGGRLTMIDFSTSVRVEKPGKMFKGICGTPGYIPPEVEAGTYHPILADLWACGKTLEELCHCTGESWQQRYLLEIARQLMAESPDDRPTMSQVLDKMSLPDGQLSTMSQTPFSPGSTVPFISVGPVAQYQAVNA